MRPWQYWWNTLLLVHQQNPSWCIELLMVALASPLLLAWSFSKQWPYLVLSLSYAIGCAASILVREAISPSHYSRLYQFMALLLILFSCRGFIDLLPHLPLP